MEIYVVQPGDTLYVIARRYNVPFNDLIELNGLASPELLAIGEAILIPDPPPGPLQYTFVPADTLFQLAQLFDTTVTAIIQANNISDPNLIQPGTVLIIPGWEQISYIVRPGDTLFVIASRLNSPLSLISKVNHITNQAMIYSGEVLFIPQQPSQTAKKTIQTMGYFQLTNLSGLERSLVNIGKFITYAALFQFPISSAGTVQVPNNTEQAVTIFKNFSIQPLLVITNWGPSGFESDLARTIMGNDNVKSTTISNVISLLDQYGFSGVNVDFENMYPEDRPLFNRFLADLSATLKPRNYLLSVAVAPKFSDQPTSGWVGAFEYGTIGRIADLVFLMTYEWGWIGGPPQAIAPINLVRRVLTYAATQIPPAKIIQGAPFYGYDWPLPHTPEKLATPVNLVQVYDIANRYNAKINYDNATETPWFRYTDNQGIRHEVWFEDARSFMAKYRTNKEFSLGGVGWWSYVNEPYGFPQNWPLMAEMFNIQKNPMP